MNSLLQRLDRRTVLAMMAVFGLLTVIYILLFREVPQGSRDILNILLGALVILTKDAYAYDFNTGASSAGKDDTIKAVAMSALPPADTPKGP